jgi:hypothetical protein
MNDWERGHVRCSCCRHSRVTFEDDDAVSEIRGHDEIMLDYESSLLRMQNEPARLPRQGACLRARDETLTV